MPAESALLPSEFDSYFRLLWLLVFFISLLMVFLGYIYLAMRKARERESQSAAFSSLALEAQETERRRIAAELHDTVLPDLRDTPAAARIREICSRLIPPDLGRFSLKDSLISLCDTFVKRTGIECIVEIEESLDFSGLNGEHRLHLYRIAQEALNNIAKHSQAKQAVLVARQGAREPVGVFGKGRPLLFSISDDGKGLQSRPGLRNLQRSSPRNLQRSSPRNLQRSSPRSRSGQQTEGAGDGFGMRTMRQRAAILGAQIDFISVEGGGLMVCLKVPPWRDA
ncbi:sensor histidine kinase [Treponema primitia]|uniref:sensor histidine kinase n=1 Tax=Treponema primitia TaxID=88058 RepID=UPI0009DAA313|nr:ATP-binding protein [Treponema primitia]